MALVYDYDRLSDLVETCSDQQTVKELNDILAKAYPPTANDKTAFDNGPHPDDPEFHIEVKDYDYDIVRSFKVHLPSSTVAEQIAFALDGDVCDY